MASRILTLVFVLLTISCSVLDNVIGETEGTFTDSRDNKAYRWVKIGTQTWMAENLNFKSGSGSWCYNNDTGNYVGGDEIAGSKLKAKNGWNGNGNGTDAYDFSALPSGSYSNGSFSYVGEGGFWWSATSGRDNYAHRWNMYYDVDDVIWDNYDKENGVSVRCIQN